MRGRFHTWTRIRVNLQNVPVELRPSQEALDPDDGAQLSGFKDQRSTLKRGQTRT